ncbi:MAG: glycosyltransferase [Saprospiraceae bacterium]
MLSPYNKHYRINNWSHKFPLGNLLHHKVLHTPTVSLIIPVHAGQDRKIFELSLQSILQMQPQPAEVILVADGDPLPLPSFADAGRIKQLATYKRSGPAIARNLGAKHAGGSILLFIDSDIVVPEDLAARVTEKFQQKQGITALFGSYDTEPYMPNFLSQYRNLLHHFVHQKGKEEAFTFWSGCGAIRKDIFLELGGFDGRQFPNPSIEDIELGYRLKKAGHSIALCKDLQVKHLKRWAPASMIKVDFCDRALPWTRLLLQEKHYNNDLNLKINDRLSVVAVFLVLLSLFLGFWNITAVYSAILLLLIFIGLNVELYTFFYRQRGWWFTLKVIPWHSIFYLISGSAFALGIIKYQMLTKTS